MKTNFSLGLTRRQIISICLVVLLTAGLVGFSAIWFLHDQLNRQAWAQVEQGQRTAIALHGSKYQEILNLATLTAQRPTLWKLLTADDIPALREYLLSLRDSADLTRIIICDSQDRIIISTDETIPETICVKWRKGNYQYNPNLPQACLTAHQPITNENGELLGEVFVCNQLDDAFAQEISAETGLEHTIWIDDLPVSTSFRIDVTELGQSPHMVILQDGRTSHHSFAVDNVPYYSAHLPLEAAGLSAEVALDISGFQNENVRLTRIIFGIVLGSAFVGSILGVLIIGTRRED